MVLLGSWKSTTKSNVFGSLRNHEIPWSRQKNSTPVTLRKYTKAGNFEDENHQILASDEYHFVFKISCLQNSLASKFTVFKILRL